MIREIKPGPKPKRDDGKDDRRHHVNPPNKPLEQCRRGLRIKVGVESADRKNDRGRRKAALYHLP